MECSPSDNRWSDFGDATFQGILGCGSRFDARGTKMGQGEFESRYGWRVLACKEGQRDEALFVHGRAAGLVAWSESCYWGIAVVILRKSGESLADLFVSAHLRDRGMEVRRGCDAYRQALHDIERIMKSVPSIVEIARTFVGMDANAELGGLAGSVSEVGLQTPGDRSVSERSALLLTLMQQWELRAMNIFAGQTTLLHRLFSSPLPISSRVETRRLYATGGLRQIDLVLASRDLECACAALEGIREELLSDHWPLLVAWGLQGEGGSQRSRVTTVNRNLKGWTPVGPEAIEAFNHTFRRVLTEDGLSGMIRALQEAVGSTSSATGAAGRKV